MCLSIPSIIESIQGDLAKVDVGGAKYEANIQLVPDAKVGDYVLIHTGLAIQIIDEEEAIATLKLLRSLKSLTNLWMKKRRKKERI